MMSDNPYQAPAHDPALFDPEPIDEREELISVAKNQKTLGICILVCLVMFVSLFFADPINMVTNGIYLFIGSIVAAVYAFPLAEKFYGSGLAYLLAFLTVIPGLGLLIMLMTFNSARRYLVRNGVRVGLFGASIAEMEKSDPV